MIASLSPTSRLQFNDPFRFAELQRILDLQIVRPMEPEEVEAFNQMHVQSAAYHGLNGETHKNEKGEEVPGFRLNPSQCAALAAYQTHGGLLGKLSVGSGKCVKGDTEIWVGGSRRRVDDLSKVRGTSLSVASMTEDGKMENQKATCFPSGQKECVELYLSTGQHVGLSEDHKVFTQRGWVEAGKLEETDFVAVPRNLPSPDHWTIATDAEVRFASQIASNGSTPPTAGTIACSLTDEAGALLDEFIRDVAILGGETTVSQSKSKAMDVDIRGLRPLVRDLGMACLSKQKRVPDRYYGLPNRQIALFLNRFIAADGHINDRSIEITLASEGLIKDIQFMLLRLSILSSYYYKKASYKKDGIRHEFDSWRLTISGKEALMRFFSTVEYPLGHEEKAKKLHEKVKATKGNPNVDVVPLSVQEVKEIAEEMGGWGTRTKIHKQLGATQGQYISRPNFERWVKESGYKGKYAWLAHSDIFWARIKKMEILGVHDVYDLSVPETKNFVGNGIILHNTLLTLMIAAHAMSKGIQKIILFIPSGNLNQLVNTDIAWARTKVHINYPIHVLGGRPSEYRVMLAKSNRKGLYVMPLSLLSTKDTSEILDNINPQLIIIDEAHRVANFTAAGTRRINNLIKRLDKEGRPAEVVAVSGTITSKSIKDYHHIINWCLHAKSPLPVMDSMAADWAQLIDADASNEEYYTPVNAAGYDSMIPLVKWARDNFEEAKGLTTDVVGFRKAFGLRLNSTPGVVSGSVDIGTSLYLCNKPAPYVESSPEFQKLRTLTDNVINQSITPNGDEIQYAIHKWKWLNELSAGFYNELTWPTPDEYAARKKIGVLEATELLDRAQVHHAASQAYTHVLRPWLEEKSFAGADTPMLVGHEMARHGDKNVPSEMYRLWREMKGLEFEGMPERDSRGVRVCDFKIRAAVEWAKDNLKGKGGIIWYYHQEIGRWLVEALKEVFGDRVLYCPAGDASNKALDASAGNGDKIAVCSLEAHGTGKNLQYFQTCYQTQWVRSAKDTEQWIGRLHRQGQQADELAIHTNITLPFEERNVAATLNDALYIHQSTGDRQKLIYATYDPLPRIYPASVLIEAGLEAKKLSVQQERMFTEKFGGYGK